MYIGVMIVPELTPGTSSNINFIAEHTAQTKQKENQMKNALKVTSFVSFAVVVATTGEPAGGSFGVAQLSFMFGSLALLLASAFTLVKMSKNERESRMQARQRSMQTEMVAAELTVMMASGNKLASKLK